MVPSVTIAHHSASRNGAELVGLRVAFGEVHQRRRDKRDAERDDQTAEQCAALAVQHLEQRAHGRRIARDLEETHDAEHLQHAQIRRQKKRKPERQHRDEIDEPGRTKRVFQPRAQRGEMAVRTVFGRDPQPRHIRV